MTPCVRHFEARRGSPDREQSGRDIRYLFYALFDSCKFVAMRDASPATLKIAFTIFPSMPASGWRGSPMCAFFDFRVAKDVTHDLNNYGDVIHAIRR